MPLSLHPLFTDHAVLQRGTAVPIWGEGAPGATVRVTCGPGTAVGSVGADGRWLVRLPPLPPGGPLALCIEASDGTRLERSDILVGDVFLCSGQSNMEWPLCESSDAKETIAGSADAGLRLFTVPRRTGLEPCRDVAAQWQASAPWTTPAFSAVAWHAGRALRQRHPAIPVGLISASWGGTAIESWMSHEELQHFARPFASREQVVAQEALRLSDPAAHAKALTEVRNRFAAVFQQWHAGIVAGDGGEAAGFARPDCDLGDWRDHPVPGFWPDPIIGNHEGVVWFACDVEVPAECAGRDAVLHLGSVDNEDMTWVNGHFVGGIDLRDGPDHWNLQRHHAVPGSAIRAGRNRIAVRVIDYGGRGGFGGGPDGICLDFGASRVLLPTTWRCRVGGPLVGQRPTYPPEMVIAGGTSVTCPGTLFAGMIAPLVPTALAGVLWYQGESNAEAAAAYRDLFPGLIADWRRWFRPEPGAAPLPFVWAQLTAFKLPPLAPGQRSSWAELREAQTLALRLPATGQAVILDCGEAEDIHPRNKRVPGERLALHLRRLVHGENVPASGPVVVSVESRGRDLRLGYAATGALTTGDRQPVRGFWLAGGDHAWKSANARIDGATVVLSHPDIASPIAARYAWADNPADANLTDATGIPAGTWRSDG